TTTVPSTTANFVTSTSVAVLGAGAQAPDGTSLPRTGAPSIPMVVLGIVLMAMGATLTVLGRARDRRRI
ncbi:MAG: LPXTG cell wall anchor domain-containing protein, partial [Acidimicrobiales bacterium]